jgi:hypothetical protein
VKLLTKNKLKIMKVTLMMVCIALLFTTACKKSNSQDNPGDGGKYITQDPKTGDGFLMLTERKLYNQVKLAAGDDKGKAFDIEKISRDGNTLIVKVAYSAGCTTPSFDVVWDGRVMMTYPYKIDLVLKLNADDCDDNQQVSKEIKIDLKEYIGDFASDKGTVFSVINASTKRVENFDSAHN